MKVTKTILYLLCLINSPHAFSMHIIVKKCAVDKTVQWQYSDLINKSKELDEIRKALEKVHIQDILNVSKGAITIAQEIPMGERLGSCHNYAFTTLMGIAGRAPELLNIRGQHDWYSSDCLNILQWCDRVSASHQPGDIIVYHTAGHELIKSTDQITHTGIVVDNDLIKSRWGIMPVVFMHPTWYIPTHYGNTGSYFRPKVTGAQLFNSVKKRLALSAVKKIYDKDAEESQDYLFSLIHKHLENGINQKIFEHLEYHMNMHVNLPDKNGMTARMLATKIGDRKIMHLLSFYDENRR